MLWSIKWLFMALIVSSKICGSALRLCDLGASDLLFVIQASFDIDKDDFEDITSFLKNYLEDLNFNEKDSDKNTRVGVILFDKVREPEYRIKLNQTGKLSKLQKAIQSIRRLPCGYWWCKRKPEESVSQAVKLAEKIFAEESSPSRMKKLVVILNGKQLLPTIQEITAISLKDSMLRVAQILVVPGFLGE